MAKGCNSAFYPTTTSNQQKLGVYPRTKLLFPIVQGGNPVLLLNFVMFSISLCVVALIAPEALISCVDVYHYLRLNGFNLGNFKIAVKKYMIR